MDRRSLLKSLLLLSFCKLNTEHNKKYHVIDISNDIDYTMVS